MDCSLQNMGDTTQQQGWEAETRQAGAWRLCCYKPVCCQARREAFYKILS